MPLTTPVAASTGSSEASMLQKRPPRDIPVQNTRCLSMHMFSSAQATAALVYDTSLVRPGVGCRSRST